MGLCIKVDLETSWGPTKEAYVRIDSYRVDKVSSRLRFAVTYWATIEQAAKFNRSYLEEDLKQANGLFSSKVVYYEDQLSEGDEIDLPTFFDIYLADEVTVEEPVTERQKVTKEVPYISFDETGEEITKFRNVTKEEDVVIATKKVKKKKVDNSIIGDLPEYCYKHIREELIKIFPKGEIINK
jgi:hypothetical protein